MQVAIANPQQQANIPHPQIHQQGTLVPAANQQFQLQPGSPTIQEPNPSGENIFRLAAQRQVKLELEAKTQNDIDGVNHTVNIRQDIHEEVDIVATSEGVHVRKRTQIQIIASQRIVHALQDEATRQPLAIEEGGDPEVIPTRFEKGIDLCCQSCTCNFQNPFKRQKEHSFIKKKELMTPILRRGRAKGWNMFDFFVFPLARDRFRDVWVIFELLLVVFGIIFSIATFSAGSNAAFNSIHLALSLLSTVLAVIDTCYSLHVHCKRCTQKDKESQAKSNCCCDCFKTYFDIGRVVLTEMILVPLLLCDIFEVITGVPELANNPSNILGVILFAIGLLSLLFYVYIVRLIILGGIIYNVQSGHSAITDDPDELAKVNYDPSFKRNALIFQICFLIHVVGQMLAQLFMFAAIGGKIRYDNRHLFEPGNINHQIYVSPELWYMCIAVTILPPIGIFTFFIVTNFWVQEFPISLCIDFVKVLQMPGADEVFELKDVCKKGAKRFSNVISEFVRIDKLTSEYDGLRNTRLPDKILYPFKSPGLVILCLLYASCQFAFVLCAAIATQETGEIIGQILNGGGWVIYYIIAVVVGILANLYVFAVAGLWFAIIVGVLILVVAILALVCFACLVSGSDNRNNNQHY